VTIDLSQFHAVFFEESFEALDAMETALLAAAGPIVEQDVINTLFRAAHSIKGGSATFGFADLSRFTHRLETLLDQVRHGTRSLDAATIAVLLKGVDGARTMLVALRAGAQPGPETLAAADQALNALPAPPSVNGITRANVAVAALGSAAPPPDWSAPSSPDPTAVAAADATGWRIRLRPHREMLNRGNDALLLFRELARFGSLRVQAEIGDLPTLAELRPSECYLSWTLELAADPGEEALREVFEWVAEECTLELARLPPPDQSAGASVPPVAITDPTRPTLPEPDLPEPALPETALPPRVPPAGDHQALAAAPGGGAGLTERGSSIRVSTEKIDALVDLVGELVITQSMLQRLAVGADGPAGESLRQGMIQLERNTRELQGQVLGIRMLPIGFVFNRFPRLVHDLALELGKQVEFHIGGEQTELDKRLIELVADPLTHLLRNAMDHGLETPEVRRARGKPETGNLRLSASHRAGSIFIEVADDGAGIDGPAVIARARELGLAGSAEAIDPEHLLRILCHPGLSTRSAVTDLSGRGVGLDVVERNIRALGGRLELATVAGQWTRFTIRIPLTLAILDGQLIRVGPEVYILPLVSIVETVQLDPERLRVLPGGLEIYRLRDRRLPVVRLASLLGVSPDSGSAARPLLVIVEVDDGDIALLVDELQGQQQIVIKGLEANYQKVPGVSAATVLGDGRVGLILDGTELKRLAGVRMRSFVDSILTQETP
jgi:two-component system chemotaxis sensor kinase CheA